MLSPHHNSRKVLARCAACFTEHACTEPSSLLNSKHFLAVPLTFAVAIPTRQRRCSQRRAAACPGRARHEAGVRQTAAAAPGSPGQELCWQEGPGLLPSCSRQGCAGLAGHRVSL